MNSADGQVIRSHAMRAFRQVGGVVGMDDLMQEGRIIAWKAAKSYDGTGTLEGYLHECLWRGFRDVVRGVRRSRAVFDRDVLPENVPEPVSHHSRPDASVMMNGLVKQYESRLSTEAFMVLCELVDPSPRTVKAALATHARRRHLKKAGVSVVGCDTVMLTPAHIASGTGLSRSEVFKAIGEVKRVVRDNLPHRDLNPNGPRN